MGSTIVPQTQELLGQEPVSAEGTLHLGVTPLGDALPAKEVDKEKSCRVSALLQAQSTQGAPGKVCLPCGS